VFAQQKSVSGKVTSVEDGLALPGVSILKKGSTTGTTTQGDGSYVILAEPGDILIFSFVGYASQEIKVSNQSVIDIKMTATLQTLGEVVVIGSRSGEARSNIETPVPVDVITAKEITATGRVDVTQILNFVAPSINSNRQAGGDGTAHIDPVSLRGVAPDQTLVLINGKRRHGSALVNVLGTPSQGSVAVDFNAIPAGAIERIEVLRDGAAAQYGSDAIAGVVNIVLKSDVDKVRISTTSGANVTHFKNRVDGFTFQTDVNYGFAIGKNGGFLNVTGQINNHDKTNRTDYYQFFNRLTGARQYWYSYPAGTGDEDVQKKEASVDRSSMGSSGNSAQENAGVFFNMKIPLAEEAEFYAFGGLAGRSGNNANNGYRYPNGTSSMTSISTRYFPTIYPDGFLPEVLTRINDRSLTIGMKGKKSGWDIDFSNSFGSNRMRYYVQNSLNASKGTASGTKAFSGTLYFQQNTTNLGVYRKFTEVGFMKSVGLAFGGEYRLENYQIIAGDELSYKNYGDKTYVATVGGPVVGSPRPAGIQAFPGFQPTDQQDQLRHNLGFYADAEFEFTDKILLTGALRYEKYSDFGDQLTWKTSGIVKLFNNPGSNFESLSVRGAVSTGFRAPSLQQKFYSATTSIPQADGSLILSLVSNNESAVTKSFGVPSLTAETSNNLSGGITSRLFRHVTATIDAYQIDIKNRVTLTGTFDFASINSTNSTVKEAALLVKGLLASYPDVNAAQFFANAIDTRTQGVDIVLAYRNKVGPGLLNLSLSGNLTHTMITDVHVPSGLTATDKSDVKQYLSERIFFDRVQRGRYERGTPQNKFILLAGYSFGKFSPNVVVTRFGEFTYYANQSNIDNPTGGRDQVFKPRTITDITLNYQLSKGVMLTAGCNNVGDIYPDEASINNNQTGSTPWGTIAGQQFGFNGSFYYGRLTFSF
jgi:iron complex outermembrane receptor protein